jgi:hypothetical protein
MERSTAAGTDLIRNIDIHIFARQMRRQTRALRLCPATRWLSCLELKLRFGTRKIGVQILKT